MMKRKKVWIVAAIGLLPLIALGILWPEGLAGLFIIIAALAFSCVLAFLPKMILIVSTPDMSEKEAERILLQGGYVHSLDGAFFPTYSGPSGGFMTREMFP